MNEIDLRLCSVRVHIGRYISIATMPLVQNVLLFQKAEKFKTNKSNQKIREIIIINFQKKIQNCVVNKEKRILESIAAKTTSQRLVRLKAGGTKIQP